MTVMYKTMEPSLWERTAARLGKEYQGDPPSEALARQTFVDSDIMGDVVADEVKLLQGLVFVGMYTNMLEFDSRFLARIWKHWPTILEHLDYQEIPSTDDFASFSFLRASGTSTENNNRSYHFLHLTFQEYFAAQYFAEHWLKDRHQPLPALDLHSTGRGKNAPLSPKTFLAAEKYNARYTVMWHFVAGLLQYSEDESALCVFFEELGSQPRDILGHVHALLLSGCPNETVEVRNMQAFSRTRQAADQQLKPFVPWLMEKKLYRVPDDVLAMALKEDKWSESHDLYVMGLKEHDRFESHDLYALLLSASPWQRRRLRHEFVKWVVPILTLQPGCLCADSYGSVDVRPLLDNWLGRNWPTQVLLALTSRLGSKHRGFPENKDTWGVLCKQAVERQTPWLKPFVAVVTTYLQSPQWETRMAAAVVLGRSKLIASPDQTFQGSEYSGNERNTLSDETAMLYTRTMADMTRTLTDGTPEDKSSVLKSMANAQANWAFFKSADDAPKETWDQVLRCLQDEDLTEQTRDCATLLLWHRDASGRCDVSYVEDMVTALGQPSPATRTRVLEFLVLILRDQGHTVETAVEQATRHLKHDDDGAVIAALALLVWIWLRQQIGPLYGHTAATPHQSDPEPLMVLYWTIVASLSTRTVETRRAVLDILRTPGMAIVNWALIQPESTIRRALDEAVDLLCTVEGLQRLEL